jgi:hypothetical protein
MPLCTKRELNKGSIPRACDKWVTISKFGFGDRFHRIVLKITKIYNHTPYVFEFIPSN